VGGILIPMIRFADDIVLLAETEHDLQRFLAEMQTIINKYKMHVNSGKTIILVCAREPTINVNIYL